MRVNEASRREAEAAAGAGTARSSLPLFVNPEAGRRGGLTRERLEAACRAHGVSTAIEAVEPDRLAEAVHAAAAQHPFVGVAGGDGSLRAAAAVLAGQRTALVPFPSGTLNHFARRHGLNTLDAAAAAAARRRTQHVPVGVLDDEVFLNTATFGYYAEVVRRRERLRPWLTKWPAAALSIAALLLIKPSIHVELEIGGTRIRRTTALVWIGVGWGSFPRAHEAADRRTEPDLEVAVLRADTRAGLAAFALRLIPRLIRSERPIRDPALEVHHTRSVLIRAPHRLDVTMDGERFRLDPPVFIGVQDHALHMIAAADA